MVVQVLLVMWLHTAINYQLMEGCSLLEAISRLYGEDGLKRFYEGVWVALILAPLARFGDTAMNAAALSLSTRAERSGCCGTARATLLGSLMATGWRLCIYPLDTLKKMLQVKGSDGWRLISERIAVHGAGDLYAGALGSVVFIAVGHYTWFCAFNVLSKFFPERVGGGTAGACSGCCRDRVRHGYIGLSASLIGTVVTNGLRVVKTTKQLAGDASTSYAATVQGILAHGGVAALLGAGLPGRLALNVLSGLLFSILWKGLEERIARRCSAGGDKRGGRSPRYSVVHTSERDGDDDDELEEG